MQGKGRRGEEKHAGDWEEERAEARLWGGKQVPCSVPGRQPFGPHILLGRARPQQRMMDAADQGSLEDEARAHWASCQRWI